MNGNAGEDYDLPDAGAALTSFIVPACAAQDSIGAAVESLVALRQPHWEAVIVSDDGVDYLALLAAQGITDKRLRMVSTGRVASGCHRARNVGLAAARGDFVTQLDADDLVTPDRLTRLLPLAAEYGAAADNLLTVDAASGARLRHALGETTITRLLEGADIVALSTPLVPLVRRDHMLMRAQGAEHSEDVIANLQLVARIGRLPVVPEASYIYRIRANSICHSPGAAAAFETAYTAYLDRLDSGDGFGLPEPLRRAARAAIVEKRELNRGYAAAVKAGFVGTFQHYVQQRAGETV